MRTTIAIARTLDDAVRFTPARGSGAKAIRVARSLVTCRLAAAVLNELRVPEEAETAYRYVNVHNPRCPLQFDRASGQWTCASALEDHPVWGINWAGAALLCERLGGRLPLASEWECFASNNEPTRAYPWGNAAPNHLLANYDEYYGGPSRVCSFPPSEIGLYDLAGNLSEWCEDPHDPGDGGCASFEKVVKGGAWSKDARYLAIAVSRGKWARLGTTTIGFRPVWDD
jgi:formylglycine-generating enzyme required for sulfatase activity